MVDSEQQLRSLSFSSDFTFNIRLKKQQISKHDSLMVCIVNTTGKTTHKTLFNTK